MNHTHWKIALRNLIKDKTTSVVCIFGLSLGFTVYILITLFIRYELSWNKANDNYDHIYNIQRINTTSTHVFNGNNVSPHTPAITASLLERHPEIDKTTVIFESYGQFLSASPSSPQFHIERGLYADHNYTSIFTLNFLRGDFKTSLNNPFSVIISESLAIKIFNSTDVIGSSITFNKKTELNITGVFRDLPKNTTIRPDYIISFATLERTRGVTRNDYWTISCLNYILLSPSADAKTTADKLKPLYKDLDGMKYDDLLLLPLSELQRSYKGDYYIVLWIFGIIALFILLMSAFNYINISIANASTRAKEIAIKKINGSSKTRLVIQFLSETIILSVMALSLAFAILKGLLPLFNAIMDTDLDLRLSTDLNLILWLFPVTLLIGAIAGILPALYLSNQNLIKLTKSGIFTPGKEKLSVKKVLLGSQFAITIFLISLSLFFVAQVNYITTKDPGLDRENVIFVDITSTESHISFQDFRNRMKQQSVILDVSMSQNLPFVIHGGGMINWEGGPPEEKISYRPNEVSHNFIDNLGLKLVNGRNFSPDYSADPLQSCIINETAARTFGWDNPLGKRLNDNRWTVVGVVADYHVMDMHNIIEPVVLIASPDVISGRRIITFRHQSGKLTEAYNIIHTIVTQTFPNDPFRMSDMETAFVTESAFMAYQSIKNALLLFTVFTIFLSIIGLFGLISFNLKKRTKEIAIRKINGSPISQIFLLLNKEFVPLLLASVIVAWPGVWLIHNAFPGVYKLALQPWMFIASLLIIAISTFLTTSYHTYKASVRNPVEALRYE
ncbi:ABC transporter permease [Alkaliflexus imshenetskii]|uniref:ABC transporter permease n=1 Tax=Alkaliflexus imshenetskii TaxID=286730 RepID=UPI000479147D|nr:ABC transporter permease [Alkaliflexus imshenetskii]